MEADYRCTLEGIPPCLLQTVLLLPWATPWFAMLALHWTLQDFNRVVRRGMVLICWAPTCTEGHFLSISVHTLEA
jgi:hypothetical protein